MRRGRGQLRPGGESVVALAEPDLESVQLTASAAAPRRPASGRAGVSEAICWPRRLCCLDSRGAAGWGYQAFECELSRGRAAALRRSLPRPGGVALRAVGVGRAALLNADPRLSLRWRREREAAAGAPHPMSSWFPLGPGCPACDTPGFNRRTSADPTGWPPVPELPSPGRRAARLQIAAPGVGLLGRAIRLGPACDYSAVLRSWANPRHAERQRGPTARAQNRPAAGVHLCGALCSKGEAQERDRDEAPAAHTQRQLKGRVSPHQPFIVPWSGRRRL